MPRGKKIDIGFAASLCPPSFRGRSPTVMCRPVSEDVVLVSREPVLSNTTEADTDGRPHTPLAHGSRMLPAVTVDTYNEELRDDDGFVGDRASRRAFRAILADWRERLKEHGEDPLGDTPTEEISK